MWTSRVDRGFTLVEVVVSLGVFAILFSGALSVMLAEKKLEGWNRETGKNTAFLEALEGVMASSMSYGDILELKSSGRIFVGKEDMDMDKLQAGEVFNLFSEKEPESGSFITLLVAEGPVLEAELRLHQRIHGRTELSSTKFYKASCRRGP